MSLLEQQNFLARIFTDPELRETFWESPQQIGQENGLKGSEIIQIQNIVAKDLNFFADSLFRKRLSEAEKLLPVTKNALKNDFAPLFRNFSGSFQPNSIKKHLEDALEFCKFLQRQKANPPFVKEAAKFELARHKFFSDQKILSICILRYDIYNFKKKIRCAFWFRFGKKSGHFIL